jgi:penicillin-binding protein activator
MSSLSLQANRHLGGCLCAMLLTLAGCNTTQVHKSTGGSASSVQTGSVTAEPVRPLDLQPLAKRSAVAVIKRSAAFTQGKKPVLYVDMLRNNTGTTLDLAPVTTVLHTELARSGRFKLIPLEKNAAFQQSLEYQQSEGALNPSTAVQLGKQTGAEFMLYGHVSRVKKSNTYQMTTNMMDLKSGELLFSDKQSARK